MNVMTDIWTTFGRDQGQIVEVAYRYDYDADRIIRREIDRSDQQVCYAAAPCPEEVEWSGAEGDAPWGRLDWTPIPSDPFARD